MLVPRWVILLSIYSITMHGVACERLFTCLYKSITNGCAPISIKPHLFNVTSCCCNFELSVVKSTRFKVPNGNEAKKTFTGVKMTMDVTTLPWNMLQFNFDQNGVHVFGGVTMSQSNIQAIQAINATSWGSQNATIIAGIVEAKASKIIVTNRKYIEETRLRTDLGGVIFFSGGQNRLNYTYSLVLAEIPKAYSTYREVSIAHRCVRMDNLTGQWTVVGCIDKIANDTVVSCSCEPKNSVMFAIEMKAKLLTWTTDQKLLIVIVPPILGGCCCLIAITVIVLFAFRNRMKTRRTFVHIGICVSFLGQGIMSLLSVWILSQNPMPTALCESIAYLKLYFAFTSSLWVFMEGAVLFIKLKKAMEYSRLLSKRNLIIMSVVFWIGPLILIVGMGLWEQTLGNEILLDIAQPYRTNFNRNREINKRLPNTTLHDITTFSKYKLCCPSYDSYTFAAVFGLIVVVCSCSVAISIYVSRMVWVKSKSNARDKTAYFHRLKATAGAVACLTCCLGLPQFAALLLYKSRLVERIYSTLVIANVITLFEGPFVILFYYVRNMDLRRHMKRWRQRSKPPESSKTSFSM